MPAFKRKHRAKKRHKRRKLLFSNELRMKYRSDKAIAAMYLEGAQMPKRQTVASDGAAPAVRSLRRLTQK